MSRFRVIEECVEEVKVKLTADEWLARAQELAEVQGSIAATGDDEEKAKATAKAHKDKREELLVKALELGRVLREHAEPRKVDVQHVADFATGKLVVRVKDSGQTVRMRDLNESERQDVLPLRAVQSPEPRAVQSGEVRIVDVDENGEEVG